VTKTEHKTVWNKMKDKWPSVYVARKHIPKFTNGLYSSGHFANLDAQKKGVKNRIRIGKNIAYPIDELIQWLENQSDVNPKDDFTKFF